MQTKRSIFYCLFFIGLLVLWSLIDNQPIQASLAEPAVSQNPDAATIAEITKPDNSLVLVTTLQPDCDREIIQAVWGKDDQVEATATTEGVRIINKANHQEKRWSLPEPAGPGRDIMPRIILPWQLAFSPDGQYLLLITMEGYADQGADYFRLWVYNLEGQIEACTHGYGINQAAWLNNEQILYFDYADPTLRDGDVWLWTWAKSAQ